MRVNALLSGYLSGVSTLATFATLPDELLYRRPQPDSWSAAELIHWLADSETDWSILYRRTLLEHHPAFEVSDVAEWPDRLGYARRPVLPAIGTITALRNGAVDLLATIAPQQWRRVAVHPVQGAMSLRELVLLATNEFDEGLAQARRAVNGTP